MKKMTFFAAFAVLVACAPKTTEVIEEKSTTTTTMTAEISEGSALYAANCGKCHDLPKEQKYSAEKWKVIVPDMSKKAKLDATAENKIMQYVLWKIEQK